MNSHPDPDSLGDPTARRAAPLPCDPPGEVRAPGRRGSPRRVRAAAVPSPGLTVRQLQHALGRAHQRRQDAVLAYKRQAAFMAVLAHELRAPLSPIRTAAALLGSRCSPETNAFVSGLLERQVGHASRLVEDLLDVARIRTGKLRLLRAAVDLTEVMARAAETCRPGMLARSQSLTLELGLHPLWVHGDAVRLTQVINNLLGNASRYTPRGGDIVLAVRVERDRATVVVSDSGIGIAAKDLPSLFEPYYQQALAVGCDAAGLGLGLSVVRTLVLAHGGSITAHSEGPGCGSQFEVSLDLMTAGDARHAPATVAAAG